MIHFGFFTNYFLKTASAFFSVTLRLGTRFPENLRSEHIEPMPGGYSANKWSIALDQFNPLKVDIFFCILPLCQLIQNKQIRRKIQVNL